MPASLLKLQKERELLSQTVSNFAPKMPNKIETELRMKPITEFAS